MVKVIGIIAFILAIKRTVNMTDKQIIINGKECRYWFRLNPDDYRKCSLRGKNDNCDEIKDCFIKELLDKLALKEQECERLKWYLKEIRDDELKTLDIEWDEYETHCIDTEYTNIINLVEEALEERSSEDCRYGK